MFQVLIAEDSKPILRNLQTLLQTSGLPVQVSAAASNGELALEICRQREIDILLTDIRMPKMDGLTLIDEAKRIHPKLKVVMISGYSDFEYTRRAISLQVCDYLLKPVERAQLMEVMERIVGQLEEEGRPDSSVLEGLVERIPAHLLPLGPDFFGQPKRLWVVRRQLFSPLPHPWDAENWLEPVKAALAGCPCWLFPSPDPQEAVLLASGDCPEPGRLLLPELHRGFAALGARVSIAGCPRPAELRQLAGQYRELSQLLTQRALLFAPLLLDAGVPLSPPLPAGEELDRFGSRLTAMIERLQKERCLLQLSELLNRWRQTDLPAAGLVRFVSVLAGAFEAAALPQEACSLPEALRSGELFEQPGYKAFCEALLAVTGEGFDRLQACNRKSSGELFLKIDEHLRMSLYSQVSIGDLSARFHVSPSYISRIVKKHSQTTFVHYYLGLKIHEARRLLETRPEMKIREIADALCFHDQHYFSKVFKEYAGSSPTDYRAERLTEGQATEE